MIVKISTPDGNLPSVPRPIEGTHYTVEQIPPVHGDMVRKSGAEGTVFYRLYSQVTSPVPVTLPKIEFRVHCKDSLGGGTEGMARFQEIIDAAAASTGAVKFAYTQYEAAQNFRKSEVADFLTLLEAATIITTQERAAVLDAWPTIQL